MYKTANVQTQLDLIIRDKATKKAKEYGFNSLQDAIRFFVHGMANNTIEPTVTSPASNQNQEYIKWAQRLNKEAEKFELMLREDPKAIEKYTARSTEELIQKLDQDD
jgi:antitoxin component of RelBE/YafQ-DinJ toxin-antitoxin module